MSSKHVLVNLCFKVLALLFLKNVEPAIFPWACMKLHGVTQRRTGCPQLKALFLNYTTHHTSLIISWAWIFSPMFARVKSYYAQSAGLAVSTYSKCCG